MADVLPFKPKRAMTNPAALAHLRTAGGEDGVVRLRSYTALSDMMGWKRDRGQKAAKAWEKAGKVTLTKDPDTKEIILKVLPKRTALERGEGGDVPAPKRRRRVNKKSAAAVNKPDAQTVNKNAGQSEEAIPPKIEEVFPSKAAKSNAYGNRKKRRNALMEAVTESIRRNAPSTQGAPENSVRLKPDEAISAAPTPSLQPPQTTTPAPPKVPDQDTTQPAGRDASADAAGHNSEDHDMSILGFRKPAAKEAATPAENERPPELARRKDEAGSEAKRNDHAVTPAVTQAYPMSPTDYAMRGPGHRWVARTFGWWPALWGVILILASMALSAVTGYLAVTGFTIVYPDDWAVPVLFTLFEVIKYGGVVYIAACWRGKPWPWWTGAVVFIVLVEVLNFMGVFDKLIADHLGASGVRTTEYITQDAGRGANIEVLTERLKTLNTDIAQADAAIDIAIKSKRFKDADKEKAKKAKIVANRNEVQRQLSDARASRTTVGEQHKASQVSAMPIAATAKLMQHFSIMSSETDPETVTLFLTLLIVVCCDPLSIWFAGLVAAWKLFGRGRTVAVA